MKFNNSSSPGGAMPNDSGPGGAVVAELSPLAATEYPMRFTYATGDRPLDGFTIKRGIGSGGFGEVYYATSDAGKEVALKLVQRHLDVELRGVTQCLNLKNPHLVTLYDVKKAPNGDTWVVMEYVTGENLADLIVAHPTGLPPEDVLRFLRGVVDAVGYLHDQGIVHRDLKPGNIFIENGQVKLGDYGLAKFISASRRSGQTESVGTVHYMAPELAKGRYGKEIDLYALGVILHEMLTGNVPFDGQSPGEILMKHLTAQPDVTVLPPAYRAVVARLLAKEPEERYPTAPAMFADLEARLAGRVPNAPFIERGRAAALGGATPAGAGTGAAEATSNAQTAPHFRVINVPFTIEHVYGGFAKADGLLRLETDAVVLEFHTRDNMIGAIKSALKTVRLAFNDLAWVGIEETWFTTKVILRATGLQAFKDVPEVKQGQATLSIAKRDRAAARAIVERVHRVMHGPAERPITLGPADAAAVRANYGGAGFAAAPDAAAIDPSRFVRPRDDRVLAGVCSGLAAYWGIEAIIVRLGFVVLGLTPIVLPLFVAYIVTALLTPSAAAGQLVAPRVPVQPGVIHRFFRIALRFAVSVIFGAGVGLLTGGIIHAQGGAWRDEVAAFFGSGAGLLAAGLLFKLLASMVAGRASFWPGLNAAMIGSGCGLITAGVLERLGSPWNDVVAGLSAPGVGLIVAALDGYITFASHRIPLRWRWLFVVLMLGAGAGLLSAGVGLALTNNEMLAGMIGPGTGVLTTGVLACWAIFGASRGADAAVSDQSEFARTQSWYGHVFPPGAWLQARPAILNGLVLLVVTGSILAGALALFWYQPLGNLSMGTRPVRSISISRSAAPKPIVVDSELVRLQGPRSHVNSLAFSPDGKLLASGTADGIVRLWDSKTVGEPRQLTGHTAAVTCVVFNHDGTRVAAAANCRDVRVWDTATGEELAKTEDHPGFVHAVAFGPNDTIATGSSDDVVRLIELPSGKVVRQFFGCKSNIHAVAFSPDGSRLAAVSEEEGIARMWETATARKLHAFGEQRYNRKLLAISPDGHQLAQGDFGGDVDLWNIDTGKSAGRLTSSFATQATAIVFGPDAGQVAIASFRGAELWDIPTRRVVCRFERALQFNLFDSIAISPDGSQLASGGDDGTIRLWDIPESVRHSPPVPPPSDSNAVTTDPADER